FATKIVPASIGPSIATGGAVSIKASNAASAKPSPTPKKQAKRTPIDKAFYDHLRPQVNAQLLQRQPSNNNLRGPRGKKIDKTMELSHSTSKNPQGSMIQQQAFSSSSSCMQQRNTPRAVAPPDQ
ncbi:unnamed protein product, partial [Amoebophrya sp. A25]